MFVKKVFQFVNPFLANLHYTSYNKYSYRYVLNDPKILAYEYSKYADFTLISNLWK
jgi:hypothetical protein